METTLIQNDTVPANAPNPPAPTVQFAVGALLPLVTEIAAMSPAKSQMSIIEKILLKIEDGFLVGVGSNLEHSKKLVLEPRGAVPVAWNGIGGCVDGRKLVALLKKFPSEKEVELIFDGPVARVRVGSTQYEFEALPVHDFPQFDAPKEFYRQVLLVADLFAELIGRGSASMATDDLKPAMTGVFFVFRR